MLIHGAGIMNNWRFADIKGLKDFQGKLMHSAVWDQSYDYKDKTVLVIGTGGELVCFPLPDLRLIVCASASAVQIVPTMQPVVKQITVFQRSAVWILKVHDS